MSVAPGHRLPFGTLDLWPKPQRVSEQPRRVRCYVRGCQQVLATPSRASRGEICPEHRIRCHHSSAGSTYSYADPRHNIIASADLFAERIVHHPFKFESHRMGLEKSEDAVSWNVFRSLAELGSLHCVAELILGVPQSFEPDLYLWGIKISGDDFESWDLLRAARDRFESNLPVDRPLTEPDIALHLPGQYLILIEAKFTSPNGYYEQGPRRDSSSLTLAELLAIYHDSSLDVLDIERARQSTRVPYQLWRNMVFAEWMARLDSSSTTPYHVNLVRAGYEQQVAHEFGQLVRPNHQAQFAQLTWEEIYHACVGPAYRPLRQYFETKTAGLTKAFDV
jgi:hypothetical protein